MSSRGILALVLIGLASGAERFAYYGSRSFLARDLMDGGATSASLPGVYAAITWGSLLATFLGAGLVYAIGSRITATIGLLVSTLGYFILSLTHGVMPGWLFIATGVGIFRVCPYVAAAEVLGSEAPGIDGTSLPSSRRFLAVTTFAIATYALINMGAGLSSSVLPLIRSSLGRTPSLMITASCCLFGGLLAGTAVILGIPERRALAQTPNNDPYRAPAPASQGGPIAATTTPAVAAGQALKGLAILAIGGGTFMLGTVMDMPPMTARASDIGWLFSINPTVIALGGIVLSIVFLVATLGRWTMTPLLIFAIGLTVAGFGFLLTVGSSIAESIALYAVAAVITGAAETVLPILMAYAALAVRGRGAGLVVAVYIATTTVLANGASTVVGFGGSARTPLLFLVALTALACGIVFAIKSRKIQALFDGPPPNAPSPNA